MGINPRDLPPAHQAVWCSTYASAFSGEVLALIRAGYSFDDALGESDAEAAALIADRALLKLQTSGRLF